MPKLTVDLYRCNAEEWADLSYRDALQIKIEKAGDAKLYYKSLAEAVDIKFGREYDEIVHKYVASDEAMMFNKYMLNEI